jgi:hypothetical protein
MRTLDRGPLVPNFLLIFSLVGTNREATNQRRHSRFLCFVFVSFAAFGFAKFRKNCGRVDVAAAILAYQRVDS